MTFVITDPCIDTMDQSCVSVCPVDCIHFEEGKDRILYINPVECIDCGACQPACPVSAIFPEGDVPESQARFIEINSLWFDDADAARAQVGGGSTAPAPNASPTTPAAATGEPATAPESAPAPEEPAAEKIPSTEAAEDPAVAAETPAVGVAEPVPVAAVMQVPAGTGARAAEVSSYPLPSPASFVLILLMGAAVFAMFVFPGPTLATVTWADGIFAALRIDNGGQVGATVLLLLPLLPLLLLIFVAMQVKTLSRFSAMHPRSTGVWRATAREWRRSEESRRYYLADVVEQIARDRFTFPDDANPDLQTYVNLPKPTMGIEVRGSGDKMYPDIVVLAHPGFQPVAVAQVESKETVTREQAQYVWAALENKDCPLYVYVPTGLLATARDLATAADIKNIRFRTWRWSPNGMIVREAA